MLHSLTTRFHAKHERENCPFAASAAKSVNSGSRAVTCNCCSSWAWGANKIRFRKKADFCLYYSSFIIHYEGIDIQKKAWYNREIGVDLYRYIELFIEVSTCEG